MKLSEKLEQMNGLGQHPAESEIAAARKMEAALAALMSTDHARRGALGNDGQMYYRVPESVFHAASDALGVK
jgi:hypothetical protein